MPTAPVDIILIIADRHDSRKITLLMNTCCEFFSWPRSLMSDGYVKYRQNLERSGNSEIPDTPMKTSL